MEILGVHLSFNISLLLSWKALFLLLFDTKKVSGKLRISSLPLL